MQLHFEPLKVRVDIVNYSFLGSEYVATAKDFRERVYTTTTDHVLSHKITRNSFQGLLFYKLHLYPIAYIRLDFLIKKHLVVFPSSHQTTVYVMESKPSSFE